MKCHGCQSQPPSEDAIASSSSSFRSRASVRGGERGYVLITTLLLLLMMLTLGTSALLNSIFDLKSTTSYNTGNQAFFTAESGVVDALHAMNAVGVTDFDRDVAQRWGTLFSGPKTMPGYPQLSYDVTVIADAASPATGGVITSTGLAPANARRVLNVVVRKDPAGGRGRGAIYLAADSVASQFSGNAFTVDGNDHDPYGAQVPGGTVEPGIATRNDGVTSSVKTTLNDQQKDNVRGLDFTAVPLNPSVVTSGGPSVDDLDRIVANILTNPNAVTNSTSHINGNQVFGTVQSPVITHLTAADVSLNGNASGAGVLIVDGSITINGGLDYVGWIIVRGATVINGASMDDETTVLGNATILGSLWTGDLSIRVGGSAIVDYCETCMSLANGAGAGTGNLPSSMVVVSWEEVL